MEGAKKTMSKLPTFGLGPQTKRPRLQSSVNDGASSRASGPTTRAGSGVKKASTSSTSSLNRTASASSLSKRPVSASRPAVGASRTAPATNKPSSGTVSKALFTVGSNKPTSNMKSKPPTGTATTIKAAAKPKRAAWDTKGKLEDLTAQFQQMQEDMRNLQQEKENETTKITVTKQKEIEQRDNSHQQEIASLKSSHTAEKTRLNEQLEEKEVELTRVSKNLKTQTTECEILSERVDQLQAELRLSKKELGVLALSEKELKFEIDEHKKTILGLNDKNRELSSRLEEAQQKILDMEQISMQHDAERRRLHNTIQELKGNIRVFCRVRKPICPAEEESEIFTYPDLDKKKVTLTKPAALDQTMSQTIKHSDHFEFEFDKVFEPDSSQATVFEEISQLVQSALDGYNVCIFAYGQTGSGKTYTMQGPENMNSTNEGMIPRSIEQIFKSTAELAAKGWTYKMEASFLEIYNEQVRDLLATPGSKETHEIKVASGEVVVTNLTQITVEQPSQVQQLIDRATKNRAVAETQCNSRSSRSHSVFTLKISGFNSITSESYAGTLNLVDLAGSERLKESKSAGDRLKETQSINSSLSCLGNVIMSLSAKKSHIPYRDSKLTFLLQNSLGGNSKTLMFVNVSPRDEHFNETVNSMRFATKVNNCTIGTAKKTTK